MTIQYDGSRYSGWQRQGNTDNTIQSKLEKALSALLHESVELSGSGRTDAGVHALGQVANFRVEKLLECESLVRKLNETLPGDIAVTDLRPASERFHARLSAKEKIYRYTVWNSVISDVFGRKFEYRLSESLDDQAMRDAAELLTGTHDFKGFSTGHTKKSTVRHLRTVEILRDGDRVDIVYTGNGFLYNMVRIMTGTLIEVGLGKREAESVKEILETGERTGAGFTAPPQGLCLMQVIY